MCFQLFPPQTKNTLLSLEIITDKNGRTKNVYDYPRFVDSYKFMLMPLGKLAVNLPGDIFFLDSYFSNYTTDQRNWL